MTLTLTQFKRAVATAGNPVQIALAQILVQSVTIIADASNLGDIHLGDANVDSATELGITLSAGESAELQGVLFDGTTELIDLMRLWIDSDLDGDSVAVSYMVRTEKADGFINEKSLLFDGVDELVNVGTDASLDITTAITVSSWFKASNPGNAIGTTLQAKWNPTGDQRSWFWGHSTTGGTSGKLRVLITENGQSGGSNRKWYYTSVSPFDGNWHHVAFTFTTNILKIYVDGVEDTSVVKLDDSTINTLKSSTDPVLLGAFDSGTPAQFHNGNQDEVSIWNKVLSDSEISEIHNNGTPDNLGSHSAFANLVAWWRMGDNDTISTISDVVGPNDGTPVNMEAVDIEEDVP